MSEHIYNSEVLVPELEAEITEQAAELRELKKQGESDTQRFKIAEQAAEIAGLEKDYSELLYQVQQKIPGETRHETAKRIIRQHEDHQGDNSQQAMEVDSNATSI